MCYPGVVKPGSVNRNLVLNIDVAPLFLDCAGFPPSAEMQGRSLRANLQGRTPKNWRKAMYCRYWMHNDNDHHVPAHYGIRTDRWKLIYYYGRSLGTTGSHPTDTTPDWELLDLDADSRGEILPGADSWRENPSHQQTPHMSLGKLTAHSEFLL